MTLLWSLDAEDREEAKDDATLDRAATDALADERTAATEEARDEAAALLETEGFEIAADDTLLAGFCSTDDAALEMAGVSATDDAASDERLSAGGSRGGGTEPSVGGFFVAADDVAVPSAFCARTLVELNDAIAARVISRRAGDERRRMRVQYSPAHSVCPKNPLPYKKRPSLREAF